MCETGIAGEIERYLRTGESDPVYATWPGDIIERANRGHADLRGALVAEVTRLVGDRKVPPPPETDTVALTRAKVEPMVRGLFPRAEREIVLATLERSVVFVTRSNIERILHETSFNSSAWTLANLYLCSVGAELLHEDAPRLVGVSEEATCYVSAEYFNEKDRFADFVVHEAAHIFHNCKRASLGLRATRSKEWLLEIDYLKRETFAYSCEAYSRILALADGSFARRALADEYAREVQISDNRVEAAEVANTVREAAVARNGWKVILARCAPAPRRRHPI